MGWSYDLNVLTKAAIVIGLLSCIPAVLALLVNFGIGVSYHPKNTWSMYVPFLVAGLVTVALAAWPLWIRALRGKLGRWMKVPIALLGAGLALLGSYALIVDNGDWILYVWPLLIGVSLLVLAVEAILADPEAN